MRGRACGAFLLPHADHAQSCAKAARNDRHDAVADLAAAIRREAGERAHRETEVPGVQSSSSKNEPIRADVLARGAPPLTYDCCEVKVMHFFNGDGDLTVRGAHDIDTALAAKEARVHAYYRPVLVRPWVLTSLGRPGAEMVSDLRRLARKRLQRADVSNAVSLPSTLQYLLQRWRAELSCALLVGNTNVYLDALHDGPQAGRMEPPPAETTVYDLQSYCLGR